MPKPAFAEMRLRSASCGPPIVFLAELLSAIPSPPFGREILPV